MQLCAYVDQQTHDRYDARLCSTSYCAITKNHGLQRQLWQTSTVVMVLLLSPHVAILHNCHNHHRQCHYTTIIVVTHSGVAQPLYSCRTLQCLRWICNHCLRLGWRAPDTITLNNIIINSKLLMKNLTSFASKQ